jgi:hypothetical protein
LSNFAYGYAVVNSAVVRLASGMLGRPLAHRPIATAVVIFLAARLVDVAFDFPAAAAGSS